MRYINWKALKKRIPHKVQLGSKAFYEISHKTGYDDPNLLGTTTFEPKHITLRIDQPAKELVHTYIHELLHAISFESGANLTEKQVWSLEQYLYYILKPNNVFKGE